MSRSQYTYSWVRDDLPPVQKVVQIGHVMDKAGAEYGHKKGRNLVVFSAQSALSMHCVMNYLQEHDIKFVTYIDSDLGEDITALATEPINRQSKRDLFTHFNLLIV